MKLLEAEPDRFGADAGQSSPIDAEVSVPPMRTAPLVA